MGIGLYWPNWTAASMGRECFSVYALAEKLANVLAAIFGAELASRVAATKSSGFMRPNINMEETAGIKPINAGLVCITGVAIRNASAIIDTAEEE